MAEKEKQNACECCCCCCESESISAFSRRFGSWPTFWKSGDRIETAWGYLNP